MAAEVLTRLLPIQEDHLRLLRNRAFVLMWSGQTVSTFGDAFFNLAVMWVVWTETQSTLQTAIIQAIWHLPDMLFAPIAGVLADRWDRKSIMVWTNVAAAAVVGAVAIVMGLSGTLPMVIAFVAIFKLNSLTTFHSPARTSIMPAVVGRDLLVAASGLFSAARDAASSLGNVLAGLLIAVIGSVWALVTDTLSFLFVAVCVAVAPLPRTTDPRPDRKSPMSVGVIVRDTRGGWETMSSNPLIHRLVWFGVLVNLASFLGPLWPALIQERLGGGAVSYGVVMAAGIAGGSLGGVFSGRIERAFGAGRVTVFGWGIGGVCILGIAASTWLFVTIALEAILAFALAAGTVAGNAIMVVSVSDEYRGRVMGLFRSLSITTIPAAALLAGWLADIVGVVPLYVFGGVYMICVAVPAWASSHVRNARVTSPNVTLHGSQRDI